MYHIMCDVEQRIAQKLSLYKFTVFGWINFFKDMFFRTEFDGISHRILPREYHIKLQTYLRTLLNNISTFIKYLQGRL